MIASHDAELGAIAASIWKAVLRSEAAPTTSRLA